MKFITFPINTSRTCHEATDWLNTFTLIFSNILSCKKAKMTTLPKHGKDPITHLRPNSLGWTISERWLKIVQRQTEGTDLPVWFSCMSQHVTSMYDDTYHVTCSTNVSMGCGIFGYRASRWHHAASWLFVQVPKSKFSLHIIKLVIYFHSNGKRMIFIVKPCILI